ncbi:MAG: hypothetical protein WCI62_04110 [Erysipelotrichaceae bacterium]
MKRQYLYILSSLLFLSACTKTIVPEPKPFPDLTDPQDIAFADPHGVVSEPYDLRYWVINKLDSNYTDPISERTQDGVQIAAYSIIFDGLKNQHVEDIINQKIADKLQSMKAYAKFENLPVYPGFYVAYPTRFRTIKSISIGFSEIFNCNNILSLQVYTTVTFNHPITTYGEGFVIYDSLNFDLNTGNELTLSDLFINGSDYQTVLNDYIHLKSQNHTDPVSDELKYYADTYQYVGGFNKIRGDVKFYLDEGKVNLLFNKNYPEFINDFNTVSIGIPLIELKDILAFGQRFMVSKTSLFTKPESNKIMSYLYPRSLDITNETINGLPVHLEITSDDTLSDFYKTLRNNLIAKDRQKIANLKDPNIKGIYYMFNASPNGPYMNVSSTIFFNDTTYGVKSTYKPNGAKITFNDVFVDGFDYKSYIKNMIANIIKSSEYQNTYDLDEVFNTLAPTLMISSYSGDCYVILTNEFIFDAGLDEGDFSIYISFNNNPTLFKIEPWQAELY